MADLPQSSVWHEGIYQLEKTDPVSGGGEINPTTKQGISNWPLKQLTDRTLWLRERFDESTVFEPLTVTVGSSGDFATLSEALQDLSKMRAGFYDAALSPAQITLQSGFELTEQLIFWSVDLTWIGIDAADAVVPIIRSTLTTEIAGIFPVFYGTRGARLPVFECQFEMDTSGSATNRTGLRLTGMSESIFGTDAGIRNAGASGAVISGGSRFFAQGADFSGASVRGLDTGNGAFANIRFGNFRMGGSDSSNDIRAGAGSIIFAGESIGGTNITPNEVTADGIIFK